MSEKYVYDFEEGNASMKTVLGGKGSNLCEMTSLRIPVPPGFIVSIDACKAYYNQWDEILPPQIIEEYKSHMANLETKMGKKFGDVDDPLLVSVRSGAAISMPGMMDTVLNLGLNDKSVLGLAKKTGNERFAWDSYRRFMQMFGNVVMDIDGALFEHELDAIKKSKKC